MLESDCPTRVEPSQWKQCPNKESYEASLYLSPYSPDKGTSSVWENTKKVCVILL